MKTLNTLFIALACCMPAMAQPTGTAPDTARLDYRLQPRQIAPGTWVIEGAVADFLPANGCNIINTAFIAQPPETASFLPFSGFTAAQSASAAASVAWNKAAP